MITMFSKTNCPQCSRAELTLSMKGVQFTKKMLGVDFNRDDLLKVAPSARAFPVFQDNDGKIKYGLAELIL